MFGHLRKTRAQLIEILQYHCALEFLCCKHAHLPKATYKQKSVGRYQVRLRTCNQYRPNPIIPSGFPSPSPYDFHKSPASRIDDTCKPVTQIRSNQLRPERELECCQESEDLKIGS
jgi:hypothetical protein